MTEETPGLSEARDLGHDEEITAAFVAYDKLVRWEEQTGRLDATDPVHERAMQRGRVIALIANLAADEARRQVWDEYRLNWEGAFESARAAHEAARRPLLDALTAGEEFLSPLVCEEVEICKHPACNAWIVVGLALANERTRRALGGDSNG